MRFSIITPSFRSGQWLPLCIASVADQPVELEHIIQDAGSDDGSLNGLSPSPRLQVFVEKDSGMYDAVNRGLARAQGDCLAYLNCDEQYLPGALTRVASYFAANPKVEVVFGNAVVTDPAGAYLWHRKMLVPTLAHTWTCPLATLTCATFFRRSLLERKVGLFDPRWRICGDSAWMLGLLKEKVTMGVMGEFTSAFTHTGSNLSLNPKAVAESQAFHATAPQGLRRLRPLILLQHRVRRWLGGVYSQRPFHYEIYTQASPRERVRFEVIRPTSRWRW